VKLLIITLLFITIFAQDNRYNEDEIIKDMKSALSWIKDTSKEAYEITKENIKKDSKTIKKAYSEFTHDRDGTPLTQQQILKKLNILADKGSAKAQYYLGLAYLRGKDAYKNRDKIYKNFKQSAKNGYASSQYELGKLYHKGQYIVEPNEDKAIFWLQQSKLNGNKDASKYIVENNLDRSLDEDTQHNLMDLINPAK
jgi:TPR repeat protein